MGISMPLQQYLVLNSGGVVTVPAVSSELVVKEPARIVVMASEGKEIEQSITRTIGRSSITIIRRQEEDVMKIPPPVDTGIVIDDISSDESKVDNLTGLFESMSLSIEPELSEGFQNNIAEDPLLLAGNVNSLTDFAFRNDEADFLARFEQGNDELVEGFLSGSPLPRRSTSDTNMVSTDKKVKRKSRVTDGQRLTGTFD